MRSSRLWSLLLVPAGLVAGHVIGYGAAGALGAMPATTAGHSYLQGLLCLAVPFSLAVLGQAVIAGVRAEVPPVRFASLGGAQVALFLLIEVAGRAAAGVPVLDALIEPSILLGALAQIAVAGALWSAVRAATRVGTRLAAPGGDTAVRVASAWRPTGAVPAARSIALSSISRRGPPVVLS